MRIISGKHKGRKLNTFKGDAVRPTSDKARESLFNVLYTRVINSDFLDLCSGTGAVGIEALSRGARSVTFVDNSQDSLDILKSNLSLIKETGKVVKSDCLSFLSQTNMKYDLIYFDPPYAYLDSEKVATYIVQNKILKNGGMFIYEHKADKPTIDFNGLKLINTKKYGIAIIDFYEEEK